MRKRKSLTVLGPAAVVGVAAFAATGFGSTGSPPSHVTQFDASNDAATAQYASTSGTSGTGSTSTPGGTVGSTSTGHTQNTPNPKGGKVGAGTTKRGSGNGNTGTGTGTGTPSTGTGTPSTVVGGVAGPAATGTAACAAATPLTYTLDKITLGYTKAQVVALLGGFPLQTYLNEQGLHIGAPTDKLLNTLPLGDRATYEGKLFWITANKGSTDYATVGEPVSVARAAGLLVPVHGFKPKGSRTRWYLAPECNVTAITGITKGKVSAVGLSFPAATHSRLTEKTLAKSLRR